MSESENFIDYQQGVRPYPDNSGYQYKIGVEMSPTGKGCIIIEASGTRVLIDADDWTTVRAVIDEALRFIRERDAG